MIQTSSKPSFEKGCEKCCLDILFTTFRPHRAIQKSLVFTRFRVYNLSEKGKSWKAPFNTHSWRLRWSPWGSKCDFCVPIGVLIDVVNSTQISKWMYHLHTNLSTFVEAVRLTLKIPTSCFLLTVFFSYRSYFNQYTTLFKARAIEWRFPERRRRYFDLCDTLRKTKT